MATLYHYLTLFVYITAVFWSKTDSKICKRINIFKARDDSSARVSRTRRSYDLSEPMSHVLKTMCLRKATDRLVYRHQNQSMIFIGFDDLVDNVMFTMTWTMQGQFGGKYPLAPVGFKGRGAGSFISGIL